jgi:hypothetical protein
MSVCPYCGEKIVYNTDNNSESADFNPVIRKDKCNEMVFRGSVAAVIASTVSALLYLLALSKAHIIFIEYSIIAVLLSELAYIAFSKPKKQDFEISVKGQIIVTTITFIMLLISCYLSKAVNIIDGFKREGVSVGFRQALSLVPEFIKSNSTAKSNIVIETIGIFLPIIVYSVIAIVKKYKKTH